MPKSAIFKRSIPQRRYKKASKKKPQPLAPQSARLQNQEEALKHPGKTPSKDSQRRSSPKTIIVRQEKNLQEARKTIRLQKEEVLKLHLLLEDLKLQLKKERDQTRRLTAEMGDLNQTVAMQRQRLQEAQALQKEQKALITLHEKDLKLRQEELRRLNQLLLARNTKIDELNNKVVILQNLTQETNTTLVEKQKKLQEYVGKVLVLSGKLTRLQDELRLKDRNLTELLQAPG